MSELANSDETNINELSTNGSAIEERVTKLTTLPAKHGINEMSNTTTTHGNTKYHTPCFFNTFNSIIDHYYSSVEPFENSGCGKIWRNHLTSSERKRFQRMQ